MKVEKVEPIPIMKVYEVATFTCTIPTGATPDDANTYELEEETEVDEPGSPIEIKNLSKAEINTQLNNAEINMQGIVSLGGGRVLDDAASEELWKDDIMAQNWRDTE